ncbi:MAG: winged helix-turn-helix domain-containing protein [Limisphaerales bacterium]
MKNKDRAEPRYPGSHEATSRRETVLRPRFRLTSGKDIAFGPGKADLLERIAESGSITRAAAGMGMSYMRAWTLIQRMNQSFKEPVVEAAHGGRRHGGAKLTPAGIAALKLYRRMEAKSLKAVQADWRKLQKLLRD